MSSMPSLRFLLHLVAPPTLRPQLPFLTPPSGQIVLSQRGGQWQLSRFITTERKRYVKDQVWLAGKYTLYGWSGILLLLLMAFGIQNERLERQNPSPREWTWFSRMNYRNARGQEDPDFNGTGLVDWASAGNMYRKLIARLEDSTKDGAGLAEQAEGGILVPGVGKTGLDAESKSYAWRRGYYEALMGAARAAEHLDGWVKDETRNIAFPGDVVIGPDNPYPKPVPFGAKAAPLQENCSPAFEAPETYYMKILTTKGFSTKDRIRAALAYADYLEFKNLPDSAEEMYRWGLDLACSPFTDPSLLVDLDTGVIKPDAANVSSNILLTTTSLAIHHARFSNISGALPIFLSVLRARRSLSPPPQSILKFKESKTEQPSSNFSILMSLVRSLIVPPPYPPSPPSGNDPPFRTSAEICEEAGVMTYIGEILFATSSYNDGLSWTREAVDVAEAGFANSTTNIEGRARCQECLDVGLENWRKMVGKLVKDEKRQHENVRPSWFGWSEKPDDEGKWQQEEKVVEDRMKRMREVLNQQRMAKSGAGKGGTLLFG
ncbi:MAG: hypothetical protein M1827_007311 [Pycnora praestabilis]|nr:MAG: hypothetical protein M1827_007311 [Pycnora praestabilis]